MNTAKAAIAAQRLYSHLHHFSAPPEMIFPLLCPVRESEWIPDWQARIVHSRSGYAEARCLFATGPADQETVWYTVAFEQNRYIRFVRWQPDGVLVDLQLTVLPTPNNDTELHVVYQFYAVNEAGSKALAKFDQSYWQDMMQTWQTLLNRYLTQTDSR